MPILGLALNAYPQILYPSTPPVPVAPTFTTEAGGTNASHYEFFAVTFVTPWGESAPSSVFGGAVAANSLGVVPAPAFVRSANQVTGWNLYGISQSSSTPPAASALHLQNTSGELTFFSINSTTGVATTYDWVEPLAGFQTGTAAPPTGWTYTLLNFTLFPRKVPAFAKKVSGTVTRSYGGNLQGFTEYVDNLQKFDMEWVQGGTDAGAWAAFVQWAAGRGPFDYYPAGGAPGGSFTSYWWLGDTLEAAWKAPGFYSESGVEFTQAIY
ncbi:MAG TPA: hypothetical protein VGZ29_05790 [Terriglobia bacterium]|nr:hypothetical protein [Terriglobia bacterium]